MTSESVQKRQRIERRIVRRVILDAKAAGYVMNVWNGGVWDGYELAKPTANVRLLLDTLFATDDEFLCLFQDDHRIGWVRCVYGNDGYDVIADYTENLDGLLAGANKLADRLGR